MAENKLLQKVREYVELVPEAIQDPDFYKIMLGIDPSTAEQRDIFKDPGRSGSAGFLQGVADIGNTFSNLVDVPARYIEEKVGPVTLGGIFPTVAAAREARDRSRRNFEETYGGSTDAAVGRMIGQGVVVNPLLRGVAEAAPVLGAVPRAIERFVGGTPGRVASGTVSGATQGLGALGAVSSGYDNPEDTAGLAALLGGVAGGMYGLRGIGRPPAQAEQPGAMVLRRDVPEDIGRAYMSPDGVNPLTGAPIGPAALAGPTPGPAALLGPRPMAALAAPEAPPATATPPRAPDAPETPPAVTGDPVPAPQPTIAEIRKQRLQGMSADYEKPFIRAAPGPNYIPTEVVLSAPVGTPKKAPPEKWTEFFEGANRRGQLTKEELDDLGVNDFLSRAKAEGRAVTRQEISELVSNNAIRPKFFDPRKGEFIPEISFVSPEAYPQKLLVSNLLNLVQTDPQATSLFDGGEILATLRAPEFFNAIERGVEESGLPAHEISFMNPSHMSTKILDAGRYMSQNPGVTFGEALTFANTGYEPRELLTLSKIPGNGYMRRLPEVYDQIFSSAVEQVLEQVPQYKERFMERLYPSGGRYKQYTIQGGSLYKDDDLRDPRDRYHERVIAIDSKPSGLPGQAEGILAEIDRLNRRLKEIHSAMDSIEQGHPEYTAYLDSMLTENPLAPPARTAEFDRLEDESSNIAKKLEDLSADYDKLFNNYNHGHWDVNNPLFHWRAGGIEFDGKKYYNVEEIQSDWHQDISAAQTVERLYNEAADAYRSSEGDTGPVAMSSDEAIEILRGIDPKKADQFINAFNRVGFRFNQYQVDDMISRIESGDIVFMRQPHRLDEVVPGGSSWEAEDSIYNSKDSDQDLVTYKAVSLGGENFPSQMAPYVNVPEGSDPKQAYIDRIVLGKGSAMDPEPIPKAPMRKSWETAAVKNTIAEAVRRGFGAISWTTGEEQARRYSQSTLSGMQAFYDVKLPNLYKAIGKKYEVKPEKKGAVLDQPESFVFKSLTDIPVFMPSLSRSYLQDVAKTALAVKNNESKPLEVELGLSSYFDELSSIVDDVLYDYVMPLQSFGGTSEYSYWNPESPTGPFAVINKIAREINGEDALYVAPAKIGVGRNKINPENLAVYKREDWPKKNSGDIGMYNKLSEYVARKLVDAAITDGQGMPTLDFSQIPKFDYEYFDVLSDTRWESGNFNRKLYNSLKLMDLRSMGIGSGAKQFDAPPPKIELWTMEIPEKMAKDFKDEGFSLY